ncbi:uncharacterized protein KY384_003101 [Bacidia gigantensis]|uniref:uncharacterized protein n=1 Tax=Bacidia gigantensis TaxID=2732470 RepID=UPI001D0530EF|nr:uncharacterized protein KY384_003101 [Bacidia gigantensis]KAG8531472.1 hypothetical protein KY384_003101 [Bacidia gigantensis]
MRLGKSSWEATAAAKRANTHAKIPRDWLLEKSALEKASRERNLTGQFIEGHLSTDEILITNRPATSLVALIQAGKYSALEVTRAFCKRTAISQQINNCLHEIFFDQAFRRAEELDAYYDQHKTTIGPLHGLPISLKDQFHVRGIDTSMAFIGWLDTYEGSKDPRLVHQVDSQIVSELLRLGAVLYCKTSLVQTLLSHAYMRSKYGETINNLIGTTLNPVNQRLSCGGSSGGEGALSALGGSPLGLGTDIGGSVRIPAAFCGIFSIKPTPGRFSYRDVANVTPGQTTYSSAVGFMSSTLDALHLIMSSVLSISPWLRDPYVMPIPWREKDVTRTLSRAAANGSSDNEMPLKFGIYWNDGVVTPHPPIQRGLHMVANAIKKAGHRARFENSPYLCDYFNQNAR